MAGLLLITLSLINNYIFPTFALCIIKIIIIQLKMAKWPWHNYQTFKISDYFIKESWERQTPLYLHLPRPSTTTQRLTLWMVGWPWLYSKGSIHSISSVKAWKLSVTPVPQLLLSILLSVWNCTPSNLD